MLIFPSIDFEWDFLSARFSNLILGQILHKIEWSTHVIYRPI